MTAAVDHHATAVTNTLEWRQNRIVYVANRFGSLKDRPGARYPTMSLEALCQTIREPAPVGPKGSAGGVILSSYCGHDARSAEVQRRLGRWVALAVDVDNGNVSLESLSGAIQGLIGRAAFAIHSTASASTEDRRWRVIIPLATPTDTATWTCLQDGLIDGLDERGIEADRSAARPGQVQYLPTIPPEQRNSDGRPKFYERAINAGAPGWDTPMGTLASFAKDARNRRATQQATAEAERAATPARKAQMRLAAGGETPIERANRFLLAKHDDIVGLAVELGYEVDSVESTRGGSVHLRSPLQTSGTYATRLQPDGETLFSLSGSDAEAELGYPAKGGRLISAIDLVAYFEYGGDRSAALAAVLGEANRAEAAKDFEAPWSDSQSSDVDTPMPDAETRPQSRLGALSRLLFDPSDADTVLAGQEFHPSVVEPIIPVDEVTLLAGHGGSGKSTVATWVAAHVAAGRDLGTLKVNQSRVLVVSAEDSAADALRTLNRVCRAAGIDKTEIEGRLQILDLSETDPTLYEDEPTRLLAALSKAVAEGEYGLVVLDNASDVFAGDEIRRRDVRGFVRALRQRIARPRCAVLLLCHVDKASARNKSTTESYSGSTAWHNSARSRLTLTEETGGVRVLTHVKANYGPLAEPLHFDWINGAPHLRQSNGPDRGAGNAVHKEAILALVSAAAAAGDPVTSAAQGPHNVYRRLELEPNFPKIDARQLIAILRALETEGAIVRTTVRKGGHDRAVFVPSSNPSPLGPPHTGMATPDGAFSARV